ncbi:hypothetical protein [Lacunimicrobium album]
MNRRFFAFIFVLFAYSYSCLAEDWTPPENPVPKEILEEARKDAKAHRYRFALVKHQWLVDNALEYQPSLKGLRVNALDEWHKLATVYEPAHKALLEKRDQSRELVSTSDNVVEAFLIMATINDKLKEPVLTVRVFHEVEEKSPEQARQIFGIARQELTLLGEYKIVSQYLEDPVKDLERKFELHKTILDLGNIPQVQGHRFASEYREAVSKSANRFLVRDVATLVAILAVNDRHEEAELVVKTTRERYPHFSELQSALDKALIGEFPKKEPPSNH